MSSTPDGRPIPPMNADERTTLESWLDFHRATLALKCEGLDDRRIREASAAPSSLTLLGLVQHMAEVERNWFQRVFAGMDVPAVYGKGQSADGADGTDGGFELVDGRGIDEALSIWRDEIARGREICAGRALTDTVLFGGQEMNLRWIFVHMIEEYARHNGHADLVRERIDGSAGV
ncbi:DinB family protein [Streptomyces spiramyceticus]|uniref:DinB family protein n=1 Tax=Streptomyces spiramyceticus TaxID=299717 RepID=UPI00237B9FB7|nr:DinB family protein [Streptomyces spiramyceticus]